MNLPSTEKSTLRIILEAVRQAPGHQRTVMWSSLVALIAVLFGSWRMADVVHAGRPDAFPRALALLSFDFGIIVLAFAQMLHEWTQKGGVACTQWRLALEARRLHQTLLALPILMFAGGAFMAAGAGTFLGIGTPSAGRLSGVGLMSLVVLYSGYGVSRTTRFLYRHAQEQAEAAARSRQEATEAQMAALQAQMNPHFLFNALNTVASLVRTDARAAESTVENLAQILRRTLDRSQRILSSVADEVDYLRAYLAIEQQRFGQRLRVGWFIEDKALGLQIPPMTLQPLVENALKHAIGTRLEGGQLRICAFLLDTKLILEVEDDGEGFPETYEEGTGLRNLRERLANLYGDRAELRVEPEPRGSRVIVSLPLAPASEAVA